MAHMARSPLSLKLAVILALSASFVGSSAGDVITVNTDALTQSLSYLSQLTGTVNAVLPAAKATGTGLIGNTINPTISGPLLDVVKSLQNVASLITSAVTALKAEGAVATTDASKISAAFSQFAVAEQQLLVILLSKAPLFTVAPSVVQPLIPVLQQVHTLVDSLAYTLSTLVQTSQADVDSLAATLTSLDVTYGLTVNAFANLKLGGAVCP